MTAGGRYDGAFAGMTDTPVCLSDKQSNGPDTSAPGNAAVALEGEGNLLEN